MLTWSDGRIMRSHPPRVGPWRRRYPAAVDDHPANVDDPATVDHEAATVDHEATIVDHGAAAGNNDPATVAVDEAAPVASDLATDEAATGGRSRGRLSAA